jgi:hypothetical protein
MTNFVLDLGPDPDSKTPMPDLVNLDQKYRIDYDKKRELIRIFYNLQG